MKFTATSRSMQGSSASRRLRHSGRIPAIIYGGQAKPLNIDLDHNEIFHALRKEEFHSSILDMYLDNGRGEQVLLRSVQWHAYKQQVLHVDFQRVAADQILTTKVPLHFINEDTSPAVRLSSAIVNYMITELEIACLPKNLPQFIEVNLGNLIVGNPMHLADIKLPIGVTYVNHGGDTNPLLVTANVPMGNTEQAADQDTSATS